jgi:hypothetical protein
MATEIQIGQFDELAVRHNAAMAAFKTMHEARHPLPVKEQISRDVVSLIIVIALTIVMVAAVIVSSSRTIDEFGGGAIGITAFVMVEGGIMAYAFFRARRNASKTRLQNTVRWATAGLILTFIVGLGANTDASLKHQGVELPTWINTAIHLLVAISAPTLAFISSDVLAIELMATDIKRREAEENYRIALEQWWEGFTRSWSAQQGRWGVRVEIESPKLSNGIPLESSGMLPAKSSLGHKKAPDATKRVADFFAANPEAVNGNPLEIAAHLEVGKSTVYNYLKAKKGK